MVTGRHLQPKLHDCHGHLYHPKKYGATYHAILLRLLTVSRKKKKTNLTWEERKSPMGTIKIVHNIRAFKYSCASFTKSWQHESPFT